MERVFTIYDSELNRLESGKSLPDPANKILTHQNQLF